MANQLGVNQGKTAFVEQYLGSNRDAGHKDVVEAWKSAGYGDTISDSLVNKTRSRLKLTGKKKTNGGAKKTTTIPSAKVKTSKSAKAGPLISEQAMLPARGPNKTAFIRETLGRDSTLNARAVNRAWTEAGNDGDISANLVSKTRADLGIKGQQVSPKGTAAAKPASPTEASNLNGTQAAPTSTPPSGSHVGGRHHRELHGIEAGIDELVFRLRGLGGYAEVQEALRAARRMLVRSHQA